MLNAYQLKSLVIEPALYDLVMWSEAAEELLLFTCANESDGGSFIHQIGGPALGIYQMEPTTYNDIWQNYIRGKIDLYLKLLHSFNAPTMPSEERLIWDLRFATAMARIHYARVDKPLPAASDIDGIWNYYKTYYNTNLGKADYHDAIEKYNLFIA